MQRASYLLQNTFTNEKPKARSIGIERSSIAQFDERVEQFSLITFWDSYASVRHMDF